MKLLNYSLYIVLSVTAFGIISSSEASDRVPAEDQHKMDEITKYANEKSTDRKDIKYNSCSTKDSKDKK